MGSSNGNRMCFRLGIPKMQLSIRTCFPLVPQESAFVIAFLFFLKLFLAVLDLHCGAQAFSSCSEWGLSLVAMCGLLVAAASLVVEHKLESVGSAVVARGIFPGLGIEPVSPLAGGHQPTGPPVKSLSLFRAQIPFQIRCCAISLQL